MIARSPSRPARLGGRALTLVLLPAVALRRFVRTHRPGRRGIAALALVLVILTGGWLWLRSSSLVSVRRVTVVGVSGPDAGQIRTALVSAAKDMTTLDVQGEQLHTAVEPFPDVQAVRVSTEFPHGMRIDVVEQLPVAVVTVGSRSIAVAADGTLLRRPVPADSLPSIPLRVPPGGQRLSEGGAGEELQLLAAAPYALLAKIATVTRQPGHGLVAQLRGGPSADFADTSRLAAKWTALSAVLADPGSAGASYIDVTDPQRPAAGGGVATGGG